MSEKTIWRQAHDLIAEHGWTTGVPVNVNGCFCAGGAIAQVITGDPDAMHFEDKPAELDAALHKLGDHVGAERTYTDTDYDEEVPYDSEERVFHWNDSLKYRIDIEDPKATVLKTLRELDEMESAK